LVVCTLVVESVLPVLFVFVLLTFFAGSHEEQIRQMLTRAKNSVLTTFIIDVIYGVNVCKYAKEKHNFKTKRQINFSIFKNKCCLSTVIK
jgi:hypothetical protein